MRIAINGFGRIGRAIFRICAERKMNIVAINDVHGIENAEYLLKYDSVYGKFKGKIKVDKKKNMLIVNGKKIIVLGERDPEKLPWKKLGVDVVVESTGVFRDKEGSGKHIKAGAGKVIITAPAKGDVETVCYGINHKDIKKSEKIISTASCTTVASTSILKVLNDKIGVKKAFINTTHSYTASQSLIDDSNLRDKRRGRAAAVNIIPSTTGAAIASEKVIPELKGKIDGIALRVPVVNSSIVDITAEVNKNTSEKEIKEIFKKASEKEMKNLIEYSEEYIVSSDIIGNSSSSIFDSKMIRVKDNLVKILAWYDNEHGYSSRVVDFIQSLRK